MSRQWIASSVMAVVMHSLKGLAFAVNGETRHMVKRPNLLTTDFHSGDPIRGQFLSKLFGDHAGEDLCIIAQEEFFDGFKVVPEDKSRVSL